MAPAKIQGAIICPLTNGGGFDSGVSVLFEQALFCFKQLLTFSFKLHNLHPC